MVNDISRVLVETVVKKTLKDLKDSPERSTRNLVETALNFSEGRFQHEFFSMADTMLKNEQSPYYALIRDAVAHVDSDRMLNFGMNLGYNSCTYGAKKIRKNEGVCGYNIPWAIYLNMDEERLMSDIESYDNVISQGNDLGIYTWMMYMHDHLEEVLPLIRKHTDCAFILFCEPSEITPTFLDCVADINHLMLVPRYDETSEDVYLALRKRKLLYSLFYVYQESDVEYITSGELFENTSGLHPLLTAVIPDISCTEKDTESIYRAVVNFRNNQVYQTVAWDIYGDNNFIDGIISDDSCYVRFCADGSLYTGSGESPGLNVFEDDLTDILKTAFSKP